MKIRRLNENDSEENIKIFIDYIVDKYLSDTYGYYETIFNVTESDYLVEFIFVEFDNSSAKDMNKISLELLSYWDLAIQEVDLDEGKKYYMVSGMFFDFDIVDDKVKEINFKKETGKFNL